MSNTYNRAVQQFEAVIQAPLDARLTTPAEYAKGTGLPRSSVIRHTSSLEEMGLLDRDEKGTYLRGAAAHKIGLRSQGWGALSVVIPPVLRQLRHRSQHTSFYGMVAQRMLHIGAFSTGRETRGNSVASLYQIDRLPKLSDGEVAQVPLSEPNSDDGRGLKVLIASLVRKEQNQAVLGLILPASGSGLPGLQKMLVSAAEMVKASGQPEKVRQISKSSSFDPF